MNVSLYPFIRNLPQPKSSKSAKSSTPSPNLLISLSKRESH
jgi:hypothetical protein